MDLDGVQAVVQISPKAARFYQIAQVAVSCADHTRFHGALLVAAQALEGALLQHPQKLHLHRRGELTYFIQKDGATLCRFESPTARRRRPGEGTPLMPEELSLNQGFRQRGTRNREERLLCPSAGMMDRARQQFLSGSSLACH